MFFQSTDDAFVEGSMITIAPRVSGSVIKLHIRDNKNIKKGELMLEIDPTDYEVKLKQTETKLLEAKAALASANNEMTKTTSELNFTQKDFSRYSAMYKKGISSTQDYVASKNKLTSAESCDKSAMATKDEIVALIACVLIPLPFFMKNTINEK